MRADVYRHDRRWFRWIALVYLAAFAALGLFAVHLFGAAAQNNATLILQSIDSSGTPIVNRTVPKVQYAGSVGTFQNANVTDTNSHSISLPTTTVLQFYFKNTHTTAKFTVTWTKQGGASQSILVLEPGAWISFWNPSTSATAGITALTIQSDTSGGTYEMFLGG